MWPIGEAAVRLQVVASTAFLLFSALSNLVSLLFLARTADDVAAVYSGTQPAVRKVFDCFPLEASKLKATKRKAKEREDRRDDTMTMVRCDLRS